MRRLGWLGAVLIMTTPMSVKAFCGFYVAGADADISNHATMVVMLREGTTTVLSMQNDYEGPPQDFAMVVPVPVVLQEENVRTLPREVFEHVNRVASPRLVEYWERDPCAPAPPFGGTIGLGNLGTIGHGGGGYGQGLGTAVVVEAEFAVGEYEIVILSARDSGALDAWLRDNGYRMPEGSEQVLRPYVASGMKFFVARVDASRVTFEDGRAVLSPLRVRYESDAFSLPVRLGLLNSSGTQDLVVHVLARNQRFEVANYPNVTIPTNIDVLPSARERFGELYAAIFDATLERNPGAVVTEYSWQATTCDPCPGPVLSDRELATLGADVAPPTPETPPDPMLGFGGSVFQRPGIWPRIRTGDAQVRGGLSFEVVRRVTRRHINEVRFCYEQQLNTDSSLAGRVTIDYVIGSTGTVQSSRVSATTLGNATVESCIMQAVRRWQFPVPDDGGVVEVAYPFDLSAGGTRPDVRASMYRSFVLTRLHYRYGSDGLDEDLVFGPAHAITGGREVEGPDGELEPGAAEASINTFQARYVIRHPWEGAVECASPARGIWGGPPTGAAPRATAAQNVASAPRGEIDLASLLPRVPPELEGAFPPARESSEAAPIPRVVDRATTGEAVESSGCGCRAASQPGDGMGVLLLLGMLAYVRRRSKDRPETSAHP